MKLFTATWCLPCRNIKIALGDIPNSVDIIDVDANPELVRASGVRAVPSLLLGNGNVVVGTENILQAIREAYGSSE